MERILWSVLYIYIYALMFEIDLVRHVASRYSMFEQNSNLIREGGYGSILREYLDITRMSEESIK